MGKDNVTRTIPYRATLALSFAAMSWSMANQMNSSMWSFFMTDVAGITTDALGGILVTAKALEWVFAIIAGIVMERVIFKWGKYGSWCLIAAPFAAVFFVLMFLNPNLGSQFKGVYYTLCYAMLMFGVAFITAVQTTMVALIGSKSREDRALLATKRSQGSQMGQFIYGLIGLPLILFFNGGIKEQPLGYAIMAIVWAAIIIIAYRTLYKNIPEGVDLKPTDEEAINQAAKSKVGIGEMFAILFKTPPMLGIIISDSMRILAQFMLLGIGMYIFTYVYESPTMFTAMLTSMGLFALIVTFIVEFLIRYVNNRALYISGLFIFMGGLIAAYFMSSPIAFVVCVAISYFGAGLCNTNGTAMVGDSAIYAEWKHKKEMKGFMGAMGAMPPKFANVISGALIGFGLSKVGYIANTQMSAATLNGIKILGTLVPAIALAIGIICFVSLNRLSGDKLKSINDEVEARRAAAAASGDAS